MPMSGLPSGVDVDMHLLDANDPTASVDHGHWDAGAGLAPGTYWGSNGYSMRLDGVDSGWNSSDRSRAMRGP